MKIGAILPHLKAFGGVRRFLEVGQVLMSRGHDYRVFSKEPGGLDWFDYAGPIEGWDRIEADVLLIGDPPSFRVLDRADGKVYVWVIAGGHYTKQYKAVEGRYSILLNNRIFLEEFPNARLCEGGVNTDRFKPNTLRVGYYAGRGSIKGEQQIIRTLGDVVKLVPIQGYSDAELPFVYRSLDYFVCAETRDGWPNTAAEALACGVPVVSSSRNTLPFAGRVIQVESLRGFFERPMSEFSWSQVCDRLEEIWREDGL